jgi:hypothetical protein
MEESGSFNSVAELLSHEAVAKANALELSICDIVHFRLIRLDSIFLLTEMHLRKRDPLKYANYAEIRMSAEKALRGASLLDRIAACCTKRPEWIDEQQLLYSLELEVWMDMSYPNPWALDLYHEALVAGKIVSVPLVGPFSETFHTLLKEKNGYEQTKPLPEEITPARVMIGEQAQPDKFSFQLNPERLNVRPDPFAGEGNLACQLVHGIMEKDLEYCSTKAMDEDDVQAHLLGYRLLGPTLLLLIQSTARIEKPIAFHGKGHDFITPLVDSLRPHWPWLPEITSTKDAELLLSIFPSEESTIALLQSCGGKRDPGILASGFDEPGELVLPGVEWILHALFDSPDAEILQSATSAFIRDYVQMSRGLILPLPVAPVSRYWCRYLLAPEAAFLKWAAAPGRLPGFKASRSPWGLHRAVNKGPWPTGSYLMAGGLTRWLALRSEGRVPDILEAQLRYS